MLQIMILRDHYLKAKIKKNIWLIEGELGRKIRTLFAELRPNIYFSVTGDNDMNKKLYKKVCLNIKN